MLRIARRASSRTSSESLLLYPGSEDCERDFAYPGSDAALPLQPDEMATLPMEMDQATMASIVTVVMREMMASLPPASEPQASMEQITSMPARIPIQPVAALDSTTACPATSLSLPMPPAPPRQPTAAGPGTSIMASLSQSSPSAAHRPPMAAGTGTSKPAKIKEKKRRVGPSTSMPLVPRPAAVLALLPAASPPVPPTHQHKKVLKLLRAAQKTECLKVKEAALLQASQQKKEKRKTKKKNQQKSAAKTKQLKKSDKKARQAATTAANENNSKAKRDARLLAATVQARACSDGGGDHKPQPGA